MNDIKKSLSGIVIIGLILLTISQTVGLTTENPSKYDKTELEEVRDAILHANAKWIAGYTSVSNSSYFMNNLCCNDKEEERHDESYHDMLPTFSLPNQFDWRNVDDTDWTTSIKQQGNCWSCIAFAAVAALESTIQIEIGVVFDCDLSEAHLFFCGGGRCTSGWNLASAANFISSVGVADELCLPYRSNDPWDMDCDDKESNWIDRTVSASYKRLTSNSMVKQALVHHGPIMTLMNVHYDFIYYQGGIYEHVWGVFSAPHAITIVGYNDIEGYWIAKNSWGETWGEKNPYDEESKGGWFRIKYGESGLGFGGFYVFSDFSGNLHPSKPLELNPITGETDVELDSFLHWSCFDPDGDDLFFTIYFTEYFNTVIPSEEYIIAERISDTFYPLDALYLNKDSTYSWIVVAEDEHGSKSMSDTFSFTTRKLYDPFFEGPSRIIRGVEYTFYASTPETDGEKYYWFFDWGDGQTSGWLGPYGPDDVVSKSHIWDQKGEITIRVQYQEDGIYSDFSMMNLPVQRSHGMYQLFYRLFERYPQLSIVLDRLFDV